MNFTTDFPISYNCFTSSPVNGKKLLPLARVNRECRQIKKSPHRSRKPSDHFTTDNPKWFEALPKPFVYHSRDIVQENVRQLRVNRPKDPPTREVPAFTIQTVQKNTRAVSLPAIRNSKSAPDLKDQDEWSYFRVMVDRGDLPVRLVHGGVGDKPKGLRWLKDPGTLSVESLHVLMPKFALGLPLLDMPYRFIAEKGVDDLLAVSFNPAVVINSFPQLVRSMRAALYSFDASKKKYALGLLTRITRMGPCGPALIPFYRQLLPPLRKVNYSGVNLQVSYERGKSMDELIEATLNELERTGGSNAYINIKYVIPTYDSCRMLG